MTWQCCLFASVDISNSTAFKQQPRSKGKDWVHRFRNFFSDFPQEINRAEDNYGREPRFQSCNDEPWKLWKFIGDEILVWANVPTRSHVFLRLHSLLKAVDEYETQIRLGAPSLGLKTTVWLTNTPLPNTVVEISQADHDGKPIKVRDFLGPGIDLGFRLTRFADNRFVPLSAGLAFVLCSQPRPDLFDDLAIGYLGRQPLKGVMDGRPYPVFFIDRARGVQTKEDVVLGRNVKTEPASVSAFLREFFERESDRHCPFFPADTESFWNQIPDELTTQWAALQEVQKESDMAEESVAKKDVSGTENVDIEVVIKRLDTQPNKRE